MKALTPEMVEEKALNRRRQLASHAWSRELEELNGEEAYTRQTPIRPRLSLWAALGLL